MKNSIKLTKSVIIGFSIGLLGSVLVIYLLSQIGQTGPLATLLTPKNAAAPPGSFPAIFLVAALAILNWYGGARKRHKISHLGESSACGRPKLRRLEANMGGRIFVMQFSLACWLVILAEHECLNACSIGLCSDWPAVFSLIVGFGIYGFFVLLVSSIIKACGIYDKVLDNNIQVLAYIWPRSTKERRYLLIGMCLLNPIVEEILFRGILVYQFSFAINSSVLPIVVGLIASLGNHAYQGRLAITTHLPFYAIAVGLLYSPLGLWGAIGFHFAGDLLPIVKLKESLKNYRSRHRHPDWQAGEGASNNQIS